MAVPGGRYARVGGYSPT